MARESSISRLRSIDWDFSGTFSDSAFSSIHWHPGRFVAQIPASIIGLLSSRGDTVLDPFCGSGTTLVEAQRLGRRSVGIDLNPVSCLMARVKTLPVGAKTVGAEINAIKEDVIGALSGQMRFGDRPVRWNDAPASVQAGKWYTTRVLSDLRRVWTILTSYDGRVKTIAEAAFSAILINVCREIRHWGYICDNTSPQSDHEADVCWNYCRVLDRLKLAYLERDADRVSTFGEVGRIEPAVVIEGDSRELLQALKAESVDLVVTSPPYSGVCDYTKAQRLSMEWFGHPIEPIRQREIGARSKRHRNTADSDYIAELRTALTGIHRCMRSGAAMVMVIGQSGARAGVMNEAREAATSVGFLLALDMNRRVTSQRRQAPSIRGEHVLVFLK